VERQADHEHPPSAVAADSGRGRIRSLWVMKPNMARLRRRVMPQSTRTKDPHRTPDGAPHIHPAGRTSRTTNEAVPSHDGTASRLLRTAHFKRGHVRARSKAAPIHERRMLTLLGAGPTGDADPVPQEHRRHHAAMKGPLYTPEPRSVGWHALRHLPGGAPPPERRRDPTVTSPPPRGP